MLTFVSDLGNCTLQVGGLKPLFHRNPYSYLVNPARMLANALPTNLRKYHAIRVGSTYMYVYQLIVIGNAKCLH